jgi:tetratricopeptide (TPR) repeat protein
VAAALNNLAEIYRMQSEFKRAEDAFARALQIWGKTAGGESSETAATLLNLAALHQNQKEFADASLLFQRALVILEKRWGAEHANLSPVRRAYAQLLRDMGNAKEASRQESLAAQARGISTALQ